VAELHDKDPMAERLIVLCHGCAVNAEVLNGLRAERTENLAQIDRLFHENNATEERRREVARQLTVARATITALQEALCARNAEISRLKGCVVRSGKLLAEARECAGKGGK